MSSGMRFVIAAFFILLLILTGSLGPFLVGMGWVILVVLGIIILYWILKKLLQFLATLWMATIGRLFSVTAKLLENQFGETGAECIAALAIILVPLTILLLSGTEPLKDLAEFFLHF